MPPSRWKQIEELYHAALECEPGERDTLLARADPELRREVESLLAQPSGDRNLGRPAWEGVESLLESTVTQMAAGFQLGSYQIEGPLGRGGMGEVFRALDTKLNRPVAIKFLSRELADTAARRRFQREAKMASSLNHPHIVTVYDAGEFDGRQYLVTEFVDGGTLHEWAKTSKRGWREIVELLTGVADGLATAHASGILHRDIKPANVLIMKSGYAKLGDFGLAKLVDSPSQPDATRTLIEHDTKPGMVVGTIAYMSPEQASGKLLDARSDIFSFGVVLYELLAGKRPFTGVNDLEVLQKIIHQSPEPLGEKIPPMLRATVEKALEKDPADRYQSMREMVVDLRKLVRQSAEEPVVPRRGKLPWIWTAVALIVLAVGLTRWTLRPATEAQTIRSIAVLPLQNLSGDPNQEFFSDGATEELISTLGQLHAFEKVISRTSVMRYKGARTPIPEIGRELGVDAILEGSVQRGEGRIRVRARLIRASSDTQLWSRDYDHSDTDLLALQTDVATAIAQELRAEITPEEQGRIKRTRRISAAAQEEYLLGRFHFAKRNEKELGAAIGHYERAIELQPDYAAAYAGLSRAWVDRGVWGAFGFREVERRAKQYAQKAVELDPNLAEGHVALADRVYQFDWDWTRAERELRQAVALDPNSVDAHSRFAQLYMILGRFSEAVAEGARAVELDPMSSLERSSQGRVLFRARRYEDAIQQLQRSIDLDPQNFASISRLADVYDTIGRYPEAVATRERSMEIGGGRLIKSPALARTYALAGRKQDAKRILDVLVTSPGRNQINGIALAYFALGDKNKGFEWLTRAFDQRELVVYTKHDPQYDSVRPDPRFQELVARLKIP